MTECEFEGCIKPVLRRGLCEGHHAQRLRTGRLRPLLVRVPLAGPCLAGNCDNERKGRGYCAMHYQQIMRGEEPRARGQLHPCPLTWCSGGTSRKARACHSHSVRLGQFNTTAAVLNAMFEDQGGACAVCRTPSSGWSDWHIDHDHACCEGYGSCGECVRGLLCGRCNLLLGHAKDDPQLLADAAIYLLKYGGLFHEPSAENVVQIGERSNGNTDHQAASV